jgi:putative MFS transporter
VPLLLAAGGAPTLFIVFAAFFAPAAGVAWGLVDRRGLALDDR